MAKARGQTGLASACACGLLMLASTGHAQPSPDKVLRYAFEVAETTMDPQKVSDVYSSIINKIGRASCRERVL